MPEKNLEAGDSQGAEEDLTRRDFNQEKNKINPEKQRFISQLVLNL